MGVPLWEEFLAFFHRDNIIENTRKLGYNARFLKNLIPSHYGEKYARIRDISLGMCFWLESDVISRFQAVVFLKRNVTKDFWCMCIFERDDWRNYPGKI